MHTDGGRHDLAAKTANQMARPSTSWLFSCSLGSQPLFSCHCFTPGLACLNASHRRTDTDTHTDADIVVGGALQHVLPLCACYPNGRPCGDALAKATCRLPPLRTSSLSLARRRPAGADDRHRAGDLRLGLGRDAAQASGVFRFHCSSPTSQPTHHTQGGTSFRLPASRAHRIRQAYALAAISPEAPVHHGPIRQYSGLVDPRNSAQPLRHNEGFSIADPSRHPRHARDCQGHHPQQH